MATDQPGRPPESTPPVPRSLAQSNRRPWLQPVLIGVAAFLLGIAAMAWVLTRWDAAGQFLGIGTSGTESADAATPAQRPLLEPAGAPSDPGLAQRLSAMEQRLGELGTEARVAVGSADRTEGLLVAFAARRALERGVGLGYLEGLLRQRFGQSQPEAVGTIIAAAQAPVTLQQLQASLTEIGPRLTGAAPGQSFWRALGAEFANLVVVRREGTPSTDPRERFARATTRLEAGQVEEALQEVLRLPGRENARDWIDAAQRYVAARQALDAIELAAFVEPRMPPQTAPAPEAIPGPGSEGGEPAAEPKQGPAAQPDPR